MKKTLSSLPGQRSKPLRLFILLSASLVVSYGLVRFIVVSAHVSLPRFRPETAMPISPAKVSLPSATVFFHEDFESFKDGLWRHFVRNGKTEYRLFQIEGGISLKAVSRGSASGLSREVHFRPQEYPILSWRWKVEDVLEGADLKTKKGSDAAARVYVIFEGKGPFSMERLLNYVWAWNLPKEETLRSYFSNHSRIVVVESGREGVGEWRTERRNLVEDYRKVFHEEPGKVKGIALMTDSDNTGREAIAYYDDLQIIQEVAFKEGADGSSP